MIFRFKPEHFEHPNQLFDKDQHGVFRIMPEEASHTANRLLDAHVATLPEVFGIQDGSDNLWHFQDLKSVSPHPSTHRARLWGIEEIKPNKCEHIDGLKIIKEFGIEDTELWDCEIIRRMADEIAKLRKQLEVKKLLQ